MSVARYGIDRLLKRRQRALLLWPHITTTTMFDQWLTRWTYGCGLMRDTTRAWRSQYLVIPTVVTVESILSNKAQSQQEAW